jgi:uncharacterized protein YbbC (DUF1343 family)
MGALASRGDAAIQHQTEPKVTIGKPASRYARLLVSLLVLALAPALGLAQETTSPQPPPVPNWTGRVRTGLEVLLENPPDVLRGKRIGLITNPTGVTPDLQSGADLLAARHDMHLVALFGPEHGIRGNGGAGVSVASAIDPATGLPVYSLYGPNRKPTPAMLRGLDALVFDVQDVGARFYTYVSTMALAMQAAAENNLLFVVLDRPDPLGGELVEGPVLDPRWSSFIGMYPIPIVHGMTVGELAEYINNESHVNARLLVVKMEGWHRSMWFDQTGLPWVMTSPGIPHFNTAMLYPAMGPIGDTSLSVGGLTSKPFEFVGQTYVYPPRLRAALEEEHPGGVAFREVYWSGEPWTESGGPQYGGVEIRITNRAAYRPVRLTLDIIEAFRRLYPRQFTWGGRWGDQYVFDVDMGTDQVRRALMAGETPEQIERSWQPALGRFMQVREKYLLYH